MKKLILSIVSLFQIIATTAHAGRPVRIEAESISDRKKELISTLMGEIAMAGGGNRTECGYTVCDNN